MSEILAGVLRARLVVVGDDRELLGVLTARDVRAEPGGRLVLGVGLGIDFWREFAGFAGEAPDDRARAALLDDSIEIITRLWSGERVTYAGSTLGVDGVRFIPQPVQRPRIPIWSAVLWPPRSNPVRRAARCDGVVPFRPDAPLTPANVRELRAAIEREIGGELRSTQVRVVIRAHGVEQSAS